MFKAFLRFTYTYGFAGAFGILWYTMHEKSLHSSHVIDVNTKAEMILGAVALAFALEVNWRFMAGICNYLREAIGPQPEIKIKEDLKYQARRYTYGINDDVSPEYKKFFSQVVEVVTSDEWELLYNQIRDVPYKAMRNLSGHIRMYGSDFVPSSERKLVLADTLLQIEENLDLDEMEYSTREEYKTDDAKVLIGQVIDQIKTIRAIYKSYLGVSGSFSSESYKKLFGDDSAQVAKIEQFKRNKREEALKKYNYCCNDMLKTLESLGSEFTPGNFLKFKEANDKMEKYYKDLSEEDRADESVQFSRAKIRELSREWRGDA